MKILLIEDHPDSRRNLRRLIEKRDMKSSPVRAQRKPKASWPGLTFHFLFLTGCCRVKAVSNSAKT